MTWANSQLTSVPLQCPACGQGRLQARETMVQCPDCHQEWPVEDSVPLLCRRRHETYSADELSLEAAAKWIAQSQNQNWREALAATLDGLPPEQAKYLERYVCSSSRALLADLLDLTANDSVLDHGCGWGFMTAYLAQAAQCVVPMDLVRQRVQLTALRAQQEGAKNVMPVVSGDYERLPFPAESFDAVVVNGVLEWVPYSLEGDPQAIQARRLAEIFRVLKPNGQLLLAIENRYWWKYFFGTKEVHTDIKWAALAPRGLANWLARAKGKTAFRAYTHSLNACRRLFRQAGFERVAAYVTLPEYNFPEAIIPAADAAAWRHHVASDASAGVIERWAATAGLMPLWSHLAYCFCFVCNKRPRS